MSNAIKDSNTALALETIKEIDEIIEEYEALREETRQGLSSVMVYVDMEKNKQLADALNYIFGPFDTNDPLYGYITYGMVEYCINLIKVSGKARGIAEIRGYSSGNSV
jgi:hypothetical protein